MLDYQTGVLKPIYYLAEAEVAAALAQEPKGEATT